MTKVSEICLLIITAIAVTGALIYTQKILIPFTFALFMYFSALPFINLLIRKLNISRGISIGVALLIFIAAVFLFALIISSSINDLSLQWTVYKIKLLDLISAHEQQLYSWGIIKKDVSLGSLFANFFNFSWIHSLTSGALNFISNIILIILFFSFLILGKPNAKKENLLNLIQDKVSRYITLKTAFSLFTGIICGLILWLFGIELALLFGTITFLLNFIPNVGSIIAIILPLPIIFLNTGFGFLFITILSLLTLVQFVIGNILEPKLLGESMDLHPVTILLFLMFWGLVWGIQGMFLAVPITAVLKIALSRIKSTQKIALLMSGKFS